MAERNAAIEPPRGLRFRVAINIGDVVFDDVRISTWRRGLENIAEPGGTCICGKVFEEINGRIELACKDIGEQQLKNIARTLSARTRIRASWRRKFLTARAQEEADPSCVEEAS
jgi:class 3 adenylate cyclase